VNVEILDKKKGTPVTVSEDEEFSNINLTKFRTLRPAFKKYNASDSISGRVLITVT
jgi:hypothetical protein